MTWYFRMALRNLFRRYGRTTLSMVSVVTGVWVIIAGRGFIGGLNENIIRAQVDSFSGHVLVRPASYPTRGIQHPVDDLLKLDPETAHWLDENTVAWTERVLFVPRAVRGVDSIRVRVFGFDPATDEAVFPRTNWKVTGKIPETRQDGILVSRGVAKVLQLKIGDELVLEARTAAGAINALSLPVCGILSTGNPVIDSIGAFLPKPTVLELVRTDDKFSHLAIRLKHREAAEAFADKLRKRMGDKAWIATWYDETDDLLSVQQLRQTMLDIIALALLAIAATGIANTVLMAAYERVREIGTLRAMGMTRGGVVGLFVSEGLVMGTIGSLIGGFLGFLLVWHYSKNGIDFGAMLDQAQAAGTGGGGSAYSNVPMQAIVYLYVSWKTIIGAMLFGVIVAVVASFYPAILASRRLPADAVRAD